MKKSTLTALLVGIAFLAVCCFFSNGHAQDSNVGETVRGQIEMSLPDALCQRWKLPWTRVSWASLSISVSQAIRNFLEINR